MERNQKEILGVMMKQVGLDRSWRCLLCLLAAGPKRKGRGGERWPPFRVKLLASGFAFRKIKPISNAKGFSSIVRWHIDDTFM